MIVMKMTCRKRCNNVVNIGGQRLFERFFNLGDSETNSVELIQVFLTRLRGNLGFIFTCFSVKSVNVENEHL